MSWPRLKTWPGCWARKTRSRNSVGVRLSERPVAGDRGAGAVDRQVARVQHVRLCGGELAVGAAQQGADAGDQLAQVVRLGEVVVGAHLEAEDLVHLVRLHGEHEDGLPQAELADLAAEVEPVAVGQAHVEDDELRGVIASEGRPRRRRWSPSAPGSPRCRCPRRGPRPPPGRPRSRGSSACGQPWPES